MAECHGCNLFFFCQASPGRTKRQPVVGWKHCRPPAPVTFASRLLSYVTWRCPSQPTGPPPPSPNHHSDSLSSSFSLSSTCCASSVYQHRGYFYLLPLLPLLVAFIIGDSTRFLCSHLDFIDTSTSCFTQHIFFNYLLHKAAACSYSATDDSISTSFLPRSSCPSGLLHNQPKQTTYVALPVEVVRAACGD